MFRNRNTNSLSAMFRNRNTVVQPTQVEIEVWVLSGLFTILEEKLEQRIIPATAIYLKGFRSKPHPPAMVLLNSSHMLLAPLLNII